jgi:hypothetical protein
VKKISFHCHATVRLILALAAFSNCILFAAVPDNAASSLQPSSHQSPENIYRDLLGDVLIEAEQLNYSRKFSTEYPAFAAAWKGVIAGKAPQPSTDPALPWTDLFPSLNQVQSGGTGAAKTTDYAPISEDVISSSDVHTIQDKTKYVGERIGKSILDNLLKKRIEVEVLGGSIQSFLDKYAVPGNKIRKIPSFYSLWGIDKYFVERDSKTGPPQVVFVVPAIREYVRHYASMLKIIGSENPRVFLNEADRLDLRYASHEAVEKISKSFPNIADVTVLGYAYEWENILSEKSASNPWIMDRVSVHAGEMGLLGRMFELSLKTDPGQKANILVLESDRTIWGESSAFIAEGVAKTGTRALIFLGSAGSIGGKSQIYDASIPARFATEEGTVPIVNWLSNAKLDETVLLRSGGKGVQFNFSNTHGHSNSPAEQSVGFIERGKEVGIDTLDVEQSLVANAIAKHNSDSQQKITFGAANLITDKPTNPLNRTQAEEDLDSVNPEKKAETRRAIVRLVRQMVAKYPVQRQASPCSGLEAAVP